ncbi:hypothetical protein [Flavobacterium gyeonganense]|jgi:hypothetical protein|uniref:Uncharacterized protein n=1 Tax=Flavobacterium gyeonganense TaxID=1310418 RepID=A0ABV5H573_9FLAO|nr:hypothetical protein [Flavobacterium gyeonganense]
MKRFFLTLLILTSFSYRSISQNKTIEGSLYIKLIDVQNLFDELSEEQLNQINQYIDNPNTILSDEENKLTNHYKFLLQTKLLKKPHFKLKMNSGEIVNVYTDETEYLKLKNKLTGFDKYEQQINVIFKGMKKSDGFFDEALYYANQITSVEKITGETDWKK